MDINELETYRLGDAVKFHDRLNPDIWGADEHLRPEVRARLLAIADDFREYLGVRDLQIQDITISGSNAAYTYTPGSDIDLHLVVDLPEADASEVYRELFDAKKYAYNDQHDIRIGGHEVELYVQDARQPHVSQGIYSVRDGEWRRVPSRRRPTIDDISVQSKYEDMGHRIEQAIASGDADRLDRMAQRVRDMRQSGLAQTGEFGPENLAFKLLRRSGVLDQLRQARLAAQDRRLSLAERRRKKGRQTGRRAFQWGAYGGWFYPGYSFGTGSDAGSDGGDGGGGESLRESAEADVDAIQRFAGSCAELLGLDPVPQIRLRRDPEWTRRNGTFGRYTQGQPGQIELAVSGRHIIDVLRTLAHEMTHAAQDQRSGLPDDAGRTGSPWEDEANAMAGRIMRHWADQEPELFRGVELEEGLRSGLAGVAAAACVVGTPGCATTAGPTAVDALRTVQTIGRTAQNLPTRAGAEEELRQRFRDALRRQRGEVVPEDYSPDDPPGPESKPTMPAGTVRVDVSDMYDWYKLGQHISDLGGLGRHDFGKGPPSTFLSFGDEDLEHEYIRDLRRTGLDVTDVDPAGHGRLPGQKTDPTFNVAESSGYIPTEAQKDDPRFSMALTQDIRPGQTGKEANKLGLRTDSQGRPQLLMTRLENLLESMRVAEEKKKGSHGRACWPGYRRQGRDDCVRVRREDRAQEDQPLTEVDMSPGALETWARSDAAQKVQVGFEFEMYLPDTKNEDDNDNRELDYDRDEYADNIDEVIAFFQGGNDPINDAVAQRLRQDLDEEFERWAKKEFQQEFNQKQFERWAEEILWPENRDAYLDIAVDELDLDPDDDRVESRAREIFSKEIQDDWERGGPLYDRAEEELFDDYKDDIDQRPFFRENYRLMSDVENAYDLRWPWVKGGGGGQRDPQEWAQEFAEVLGMPVKTGSYHGSKRSENWANLEVDGSLLEPRSKNDAGLELITPYRPLPEALRILDDVTRFARANGIYTNETTGLHMNVSLKDVKNVDWVKLVLFMGDRYVLDSFERAANTYAESSLAKIQAKVRQQLSQSMKEDANDRAIYRGDLDIVRAMELMRSNMIELARQAVQSGLGGEKRQSAHIKDQPDGSSYIEFRGPGNNWLSRQSPIRRRVKPGFTGPPRPVDILQNTVFRLARAMTIAADPAAERSEYAQKLYKMLTGYKGAVTYQDPRSERGRTEIETEIDDKLAKIFSDYAADLQAAGDDKEKREKVFRDTKRLWADLVVKAERKSYQQQKPGFRDYAILDRQTGDTLEQFQASGDQDAVNYARSNYPGVDYEIKFIPSDKDVSANEKRRRDLAQRLTNKDTWWKVTVRDQPDIGPEIQGWVKARTSDEAIENFQAIHPNATYRVNDISDFQAEIDEPRPLKPPPPPPRTIQGRTFYITRFDRHNWALVDADGDSSYRFSAATQDQALDRLRSWQNENPGDTRWLVPLVREPSPAPDTVWNVTYTVSGGRGARRTVSTEVKADSERQAIDLVMMNYRSAIAAPDIRAEIQQPEPQPAVSTPDPNQPSPGESDWLVSWSEYRSGDGGKDRLVKDSVRTTARTAADASSRLIDALAAQGRVAFDVTSVPTDAPAWRAPRPLPIPRSTASMGAPRANTTRNPDANYAIVHVEDNRVVLPFRRDNDREALEFYQEWVKERTNPRGYQLVPLENAIPGSTLDIQRRRQQAASQLGEFTGRWLVRDSSTGDVLHTISGIGNAQADANRYARQWAQRQGVAHIPLEVVPEMR